jgi:hypothetical protein
MNQHDRQFPFDAIIDRALAGYAAEPRPGLENRTLARLQAAKEARSRALGWRWLLSGAVAASLAVGGFWGMQTYRAHRAAVLLASQQSRPAAGQVAYNNLPSSARVEVKPEVAPTKRSTHRGAGVSAENVRATIGEPRSAQFPSPAPLSRQEMLLARLAAAGPKFVGTLLQSNQSEQIEPVKIQPLEIAPLEITGSSSSQVSTNPASQASPQSGPQQSNR